MVTVDQQSEDINPGIVCPNCGCNRMPATHTRRNGKNNIRFRRCKECGKRVRTREVIVQMIDD